MLRVAEARAGMDRGRGRRLDLRGVAVRVRARGEEEDVAPLQGGEGSVRPEMGARTWGVPGRMVRQEQADAGEEGREGDSIGVRRGTDPTGGMVKGGRTMTVSTKKKAVKKTAPKQK